jgi:hypothetical protein
MARVVAVWRLSIAEQQQLASSSPAPTQAGIFKLASRGPCRRLGDQLPLGAVAHPWRGPVPQQVLLAAARQRLHLLALGPAEQAQVVVQHAVELVPRGEPPAGREGGGKWRQRSVGGAAAAAAAEDAGPPASSCAQPAARQATQGQLIDPIEHTDLSRRPAATAAEAPRRTVRECGIARCSLPAAPSCARGPRQSRCLSWSWPIGLV